MEKLTYFYLNECPFCEMADRAFAELTSENPEYASVEVERFEEEENPQVVANYDYYHVPCLFLGEEKLFEAYFMIPYDEVKAGVKAALDRVMAD